MYFFFFIDLSQFIQFYFRVVWYDWQGGDYKTFREIFLIEL